MDNELAIALPRAELELLRSTAKELGIKPEELAAKLVSDELNQRCKMANKLASVVFFSGPNSGLSGDFETKEGGVV